MQHSVYTKDCNSTRCQGTTLCATLRGGWSCFNAVLSLVTNFFLTLGKHPVWQGEKEGKPQGKKRYWRKKSVAGAGQGLAGPGREEGTLLNRCRNRVEYHFGAVCRGKILVFSPDFSHEVVDFPLDLSDFSEEKICQIRGETVDTS